MPVDLGVLAELGKRPLVHVGVERVDGGFVLGDVGVQRGEDPLAGEQPEALGGEVHRVDRHAGDEPGLDLFEKVDPGGDIDEQRCRDYARLRLERLNALRATVFDAAFPRIATVSLPVLFVSLTKDRWLVLS